MLSGKHWDPLGRVWRSGDSCLVDSCCSTPIEAVDPDDIFQHSVVLDAERAVQEASEELMALLLSPVLDREGVEEMVTEVHRAEMVYRLTVGSLVLGEEPPPLDLLWPITRI